MVTPLCLIPSQPPSSTDGTPRRNLNLTHCKVRQHVRHEMRYMFPKYFAVLTPARRRARSVSTLVTANKRYSTSTTTCQPAQMNVYKHIAHHEHMLTPSPRILRGGKHIDSRQQRWRFYREHVTGQ